MERHLGPRENDVQQMLKEIGLSKLENLIDEAIPAEIRISGFEEKYERHTQINSESLYLDMLKKKAYKNIVKKSYQGQGYSPTLVPNVILRNVFENPNWYTPYTPYQAEISQGRLESLLNF